MEVLVVTPDPAWPAAFAREARRISASLSPLQAVLHHIGSTAIRGIHAKPIIDMLLVVPDVWALDHRGEDMRALGYEAMGEFGIPGRRYFRKSDAAGRRTHHVHAFESGSPHVQRHLAFRDYMNSHASAAQAYGVLKQTLAATFPRDIEAYVAGKNSFIQEHEAKALAYYGVKG